MQQDKTSNLTFFQWNEFGPSAGLTAGLGSVRVSCRRTVAARFCGLRFLMWFLKIVRSCGLWLLWSQMLRQPHGDRKIHWIKNRKVTARRPGGDRTRRPHGSCSYHKFAVRPPWGRRRDAVRPPYDFLGTQDRVKYVCHLTAIARRPYGHRTVALWCGCGIAVSEKKFNVKLKNPQGLRWPCGVLKTVRSPYGLHKNRKAAVRFGGQRSPPQTHRKLYMWPWHYTELWYFLWSVLE